MRPGCLIVDDEPIAAKGLAEDLTALDIFTVTAVAANAAQALEAYAQFPADLVFLDIEMPGMTGLELLRRLPGQPLVILVTAYQQYALDGYEHGVVDYLLKPVSLPRLRAACEKALEWYRLRHPTGHLLIKCNGTFERIDHGDILYLEAANNYVWIHTRTRKYMVYHSMKSLEDRLPNDLFVRTHKSFLVSKSFLTRIAGDHVLLGEKPVPLSRRYKTPFLRRLQVTKKKEPDE